MQSLSFCIAWTLGNLLFNFFRMFFTNVYRFFSISALFYSFSKKIDHNSAHFVLVQFLSSHLSGSTLWILSFYSCLIRTTFVTQNPTWHFWLFLSNILLASSPISWLLVALIYNFFLTSSLFIPNSTEKLLVLLRDGRKLLGILRSFDQFGTDFSSFYNVFYVYVFLLHACQIM